MSPFLNVMGFKVFPEKSELLYEAKFTEELLRRDFELASGNWSVSENGWLTGSIPIDGGGLIYSNRHFMGNVLLDFYGATVPPYANDLNFTFCAKGWNYEKNDADISYIAGLQGWWTGKTGIEKYSLNNQEIQAMTCLHNFQPGHVYHIQTGRISDYCFLFIDGVLAVEMRDPSPITEFGRVGFGVYAGSSRFSDLKVFKPYVEPFQTSYAEIRSKQ